MRQKKILLIDDEELITRTLIKALERSNYEVMVAKNGADAIIMVEEEEGFDLVISDVRMPGKNGVETVKEILRILSKRGVESMPAIFITGYADKDIEEQAMTIKPTAYIHKPFEFDFFMQEVKKAIGT